MPSAARHTTPRGLSPKRLLEFIMPELNLHCLRLASNSPKVRDTLLKLDEQGVSNAASAVMERQLYVQRAFEDTEYFVQSNRMFYIGQIGESENCLFSFNNQNC